MYIKLNLAQGMALTEGSVNDGDSDDNDVIGCGRRKVLVTENLLSEFCDCCEQREVRVELKMTWTWKGVAQA